MQLVKLVLFQECKLYIFSRVQVIYIFISGNSNAEAYERAQSVLNAIYDYMYAYQLHINVEKSCYMHFRHEYSNKERLVCARTDRTYDR